MKCPLHQPPVITWIKWLLKDRVHITAHRGHIWTWVRVQQKGRFNSAVLQAAVSAQCVCVCLCLLLSLCVTSALGSFGIISRVQTPPQITDVDRWWCHLSEELMSGYANRTKSQQYLQVYISVCLGYHVILKWLYNIAPVTAISQSSKGPSWSPEQWQSTVTVSWGCRSMILGPGRCKTLTNIKIQLKICLNVWNLFGTGYSVPISEALIRANCFLVALIQSYLCVKA